MLSRMRSIILVNKWLATDTWSQVDMGPPDMTALAINTGRGKVLLNNMYNDSGQQQGLEQSIQAFQKRSCVGGPEGHVEKTIWLGDFNLHHPLWDKACNGHLFTRSNLEKSQALIDALAEFNSQMALPKDIPTLQALSTGNHMRTDNVFVSSLIVSRVIRCTMQLDERTAISDHILVVMEVNLLLEEWVKPLHPNFRSAD